MKLLSKDAALAMQSYIDSVSNECMSEGESNPLFVAYAGAQTIFERSAIAAAIVYRADADSDRAFKIIDEAGELADKRLVTVADSLSL
jgi:hypothetical protein